MRILAIRGSNLASLAGPFAVELAEGTLAGAGLFAITGPTGAGKSTILDALCLALFDTLPRLPVRGRGGEIGPRGGDDATRVRADDVRSILRHGCGDGHAEVDFRGIDGRSYRARWEVRRARRRANGRMQNQEMSLHDLADGSVLGGVKTEVKQLIAERLGLSFDQFRRSVLLAQGDFAAFLRADPKDRSELLERITGSEIYSRLSVACHRRESTVKAARDLAAVRLDGCQLLGDEERIELEGARQSQLAAIAAAEQDADKLRRAHEWFIRRDQLTGALSQAESELLTANEAWQEAADRRNALLAINAAQRHRHAVESADLGRHEVKLSEQKAADAEQRLAALRTVYEDRAHTLEAARTSLRTLAEKELEMRPRLERARLLEDRRTELEKLRSQADATHETSLAEADRAAAALAELRSESESLEHELSAHQSWIEEHQHLSELGQRWDRWQLLLGAFEESASELAEMEAQRRAALARQESQTHQLTTARSELELATATHDEARAAAAELSAQAQELSYDELSERRKQTEDRRQTVARQLDLAKRAARLDSELELCEQELAQGATRRRESSARLEQLEAQLPKLRSALEEARRSHRLTLAACKEDLGELRNALADGEPCPLCGSTVHPWTGETAGLRRLADRGEARMAELSAEVEQAVGERHALDAALKATDERSAHLGARLEGLRSELAAVVDDWRSFNTVASRGDQPGREDVAARLENALADADRELDAIRQEERRAHQLQKRLDGARSTVDTTRGRADEARDAVAELELHLTTERTRDQELQDRIDRARRTRDARWSELAGGAFASISELPAEPPADPGELIETCRSWAKAWREHDRACETARHGLATLSTPLNEAAAASKRADERVRELADALAAHDAQLAALGSELQHLIGGRTVDEVKQELDAELARARTIEDEAQRAHVDAERELATATGVLTSARESVDSRRHDCGLRARELAKRLQASALDESELRHLLSFDEQWRAEEERALAEISDARDERRILCDERRARLAEHEEHDTPAGSPEEVTAALEEGAKELQRLRVDLSETEHRLRSDDETRRELAELSRAHDEAQAEWQTWAALKELIGSADGSKFRGFAQSLTLSNLLAHANGHLTDLARRYRLERVPGIELELQVVDRDMADEVRSVFSLSGGESFLVSLALALGLASLSARSTRVESLFIDEGFGSLDADSLETAVASLDALQSLGRQVGVISHVATLVERIGYQIKVERRGGGRSTVSTVSA